MIRLPRLRFSLRTLVIFVLLCGSGFGLWYRWEPWVLKRMFELDRPCEVAPNGVEHKAGAVFTRDSRRIIAMRSVTHCDLLVENSPSTYRFRVAVFEIDDGLIWTNAGIAKRPCYCEFEQSPGGNWVAYGALGDNPFEHIRSIKTGEPLSIPHKDVHRSNEIPGYVLFSADDRLAATNDGKMALLFDPLHGHAIRELNTQDEEFSLLGFSADGQWVLIVASDIPLAWSLADGCVVKPVRLDKNLITRSGMGSVISYDPVQRLAEIPKQQHLGCRVRARNGYVEVSDAGQGYRVLRDCPSGQRSAACSEDGSLLLGVTAGGLVRVWARSRPAEWWGVAWLPDFWATLLFGGAFVWSVWRDRQRWAPKPAPDTAARSR